MNAVSFETVVTDEHQLHYALPASLPTGCRVRVVIEPIEEAASDPLDWPLTEEEREVLEEFPTFRAEHPVRFGSLKAKS
jgi:hypothetical protein